MNFNLITANHSKSTQFLRRSSRGNFIIIAFELLHQLVLVCEISEYNLKGLPYTLKSPNKQFTHSLSSSGKFTEQILYFKIIAPISVFYVKISSSSLRLFTIDPFVSFLPATHQQFLLHLPVGRGGVVNSPR